MIRVFNSSLRIQIQHGRPSALLPPKIYQGFRQRDNFTPLTTSQGLNQAPRFGMLGPCCILALSAGIGLLYKALRENNNTAEAKAKFLAHVTPYLGDDLGRRYTESIFEVTKQSSGTVDKLLASKGDDHEAFVAAIAAHDATLSQAVQARFDALRDAKKG